MTSPYCVSLNGVSQGQFGFTRALMEVRDLHAKFPAGVIEFYNVDRCDLKQDGHFFDGLTDDERAAFDEARGEA